MAWLHNKHRRTHSAKIESDRLSSKQQQPTQSQHGNPSSETSTGIRGHHGHSATTTTTQSLAFAERHQRLPAEQLRSENKQIFHSTKSFALGRQRLAPAETASSAFSVSARTRAALRRKANASLRPWVKSPLSTVNTEACEEKVHV